jgi:hypothetical protein
MVNVGDAQAPPRSEDAMDGSSFDSLVRLARAAASRRNAVKAALFPAVTGVGAALIAPRLSEAKKKKKKCKKCKAKDLGQTCSTNKECCTNETNRLCAIPSNPSSGQTVCCGGVGAKCSSTDDCCGDFVCENGVCDA